MLHFIGFKGDEYGRAVRLFGRPDFVHQKATWTLLGDIPATDRVVFGPFAFNRRRTAH